MEGMHYLVPKIQVSTTKEIQIARGIMMKPRFILRATTMSRKTKFRDLGCTRKYAAYSSSPLHPSLPVKNKDEVSDNLCLESLQLKKDQSSIKILTYNICVRKDIELQQERMDKIGDLIHMHSPDVICFQEVTLNVYKILHNSNWWKLYQSTPLYKMIYSSTLFSIVVVKRKHLVKSFIHEHLNMIKNGRGMPIAEIKLKPNKILAIATAHLKSPSPPSWERRCNEKRVYQAKKAINILDKYSNVVFGGDMNWDDNVDGVFPLPESGWIDAWLDLRPAEKGYTFDNKSNKMLAGGTIKQKRLDRFVCKLEDFKVGGIEMVGTEEIPGLVYTKERKSYNVIKKRVLPVLPSDHYGLLLTIHVV